ncbi:MAG: protein translocase subunit SecF [Acidobacteria bacterium]|nr:protein translocase subunit SecF [Acidobacteriota bacterium]
MQLFKQPNFNFIRWRWHAIVLSLLVIGAGVAGVVSRGLPLGVDFSGGTIVVVRFDQPVTTGQVRAAVSLIPGDIMVQDYGDPADREILIRLPQIETAEEGASLELGAQQIIGLLQTADLGSFEVRSTEVVGPVIGEDLQRRGIYAMAASIVAIAIYITLRFRFSFAVGAQVAVIHDILVTLAFLTFFGYELSLNVVAAILAISGYSVNDTIVVFDRVRENLRSLRRDSLERVINTSVNQTLARTVITSGTTTVAVLALFVFGGEVLRGFAFTMLVGLITGTYSTVFIASSVAIMIGERGRPRAAAASAPAAAGATAPDRPSRKSRRARAS